ncbi:MAG: hypothetical protein ACKO47_04395, partial [Alphaproteobacteria bacterium]
EVFLVVLYSNDREVFLVVLYSNDREVFLVVLYSNEVFYSRALQQRQGSFFSRDLFGRALQQRSFL